jgi:hypothetical protein
MRRWSKGTVILWQLGLARQGLVVLVAYAFIASPLMTDCPKSNGGGFLGGTWTGAQTAPGSVLAAVVLGGSLWLSAGVGAWMLRRGLVFLNVLFLGLFLTALVVLWQISPLLWGPRLCDGLPAPSSSLDGWALVAIWWLVVIIGRWLAKRRQDRHARRESTGTVKCA